MPDKQRIEKLSEFLEDKSQDICIVMHANPDGDAVGSSLGLYAFLSDNGYKNLSVAAPDEYPEFLHWMPGNDKVLIASAKGGAAEKKIRSASLIFCLDFNGFARAGKLEKSVAGSSASKVMIDHHPQPGDGFDLVFSDTEASSTAELIYEIITVLKGSEFISLDSAQCLYAGIVTDTGSFSYGCNNPRTYEIVARLIEKGVNGEYIHRLIYSTYSEDRMRLLGFCLSEKLCVLQRESTAFISLTREDMKRFNYREGDTEGVVNYALNIKGINLAALFTEMEDHVKVSFRSAGNLDVNSIARNHYNGGGHKNAAGGKSYMGMEQTIEEFTLLVKEKV